jgi:hypothetical protein
MFCTCEQKFKIHSAQTERIKIDTDESTMFLGDLIPVVVANFMYQLNWARGYPNIWLKIIEWFFCLFVYLFVLVVLGFEFRASGLLGRCFTT